MSDREGMGDVILCGCGCGTRLKQFDDQKRPRAHVRGHYLRVIVNSHRKQTVDVPRETAVEVQPVR